MIDVLKKGKCPFTGKPYDCGRCEPLDARPQIGDRCIVSERWEAVITAYTARASGQREYQLEWIGDGELKSDWLTLERMRLLGIKLFRDGREVRL